MASDEAPGELVAMMQRALRAGLVHGTAGNAACRLGDGNIAVTPSSLRYDAMTPDDIVVVTPDGDVVNGTRRPTTETAMHLAVLNRFPEFGTSLHCHSTYATMFAVTRQRIPSAIEEFTIHVGGGVPVADYAPTGSDQLAAEAARHLTERSAVLLANHGLLVAAPSADQALDLAVLVEHTAEIMWGARMLGDVVALPDSSEQVLRPLYELSRAGWS